MTTVVHHSADMDGVFCREIARKFLPDAELIGWDFADAPINLETIGDTLYVLDLPLDRPFGFRFEELIKDSEAKAKYGNRIGNATNIIWIDHHASSIASHPSSIPGYRIDGVAACRLAWQWFAGEPPNFANRGGDQRTMPSKEDFVERRVAEPLAVRLAGEYDIWDKRDPRADVFQFGLRSRELSTHDWQILLGNFRKPTVEEIERMIDVGHPIELRPDGTVDESISTVDGLLRDGALLQTYQQRNDKSAMGRSFIVEWEGLKFLALTTARCNSLTFAAKDVPETGHDALMGFYFNGKVWTVSLYHAAHRTDLDLSKIAVKHGGGGHRGAAGFTTTFPTFLK
jgi:oligoribonuclease NrnB/cAMP/cGMP phosphodiesterase (DHH superfamily)